MGVDDSGRGSQSSLQLEDGAWLREIPRLGCCWLGSAVSADLLFAGGRIYAIFIAQELCRYYVVCMQCSYVCMYLIFHSSLPLFETATRNPLITLDIMVQESFKALP